MARVMRASVSLGTLVSFGLSCMPTVIPDHPSCRCRYSLKEQFCYL